MKTNYVLVDFENVQPKNLEMLREGQFKIKMFVGANQKIPVDVAKTLQAFGADAEYIQIWGNGKNALDFHIAYYIGRLAAESAEAYFHIISKDTGFDPLVAYLKKHAINCRRLPSLNEIPLVKKKGGVATAPPPEPEALVAPLVTAQPGPHKVSENTKSIPKLTDEPQTRPAPRKTPPTNKPKPVATIIKHLAKSTKPRTEKTLRSTIKGVLGADASDQQISSVVKELQKNGSITITEGKVTYNLPT